jgi:hypothetical protein
MLNQLAQFFSNKWVRYTLLLLLLLLVAWGGYAAWASYTNTPLRVRITNVTGRSATVSWVTDTPTKGMVVYKEASDSLMWGPLAKFGAQMAYDDRDYAGAVLASSKEASKDGELSAEVLGDVKVTKVGNYFVHHVTLLNLEEKTKYAFKIGDGLMWWDADEEFNKDGRGWVEFADVFEFTTFEDPAELTAPDPAYGRVYSLIDEDGVLSDSVSVDSLVFARAIEGTGEDGEVISLPLSTITNLDGGWSIDKSNFRNEDGTMATAFEPETAIINVLSEFEGTNETRENEGVWGVTDSPMSGIYYDLGEREENASLLKVFQKPAQAEERRCGVRSCEDPTCICQVEGGGWEETGGECFPRGCVNENRPGHGSDQVCDPQEQQCQDQTAEERADAQEACLEEAAAIEDDCVIAKCVNGVLKKTANHHCATSGGGTNAGGSGSGGTGGAGAGAPDDEEETVCRERIIRHEGVRVECPNGSTGGERRSPVAGCTVSTPSADANKPKEGDACDLPNRREGTINKNGRCVGSDAYELGASVIPTVVNGVSTVINTGVQVAQDVWGAAVDCGFGWCLLTGAIDNIAHTVGGAIDTVGNTLSTIGDIVNAAGDFYSGVGAGLIEVNVSGTDSFLTGKVYAAETTLTADSGNDYVVYFPEDGVYDINIPGVGNAHVVGVSGMPYMFFINRNSENGYQAPADVANPASNEDVLVKLTGFEVQVGKTSDVFDVKLTKGINIVSFPFMPADEDKNPINASEFLNIANDTAPGVTAITHFDAGKWAGGLVRESTDTSTYSGTDFPLTFGRGYLILSDRDMTVKISGYSVESEVPIAFKPGWNLVGVHGYDQTYTASSFIDSVNGINSLTADNVTWYPTSKGRYEGFQKSEGAEYGLDFPILDDLGYFVKIIKFEPTDPATKSVIWQPGGELHGLSGSGNN